MRNSSAAEDRSPREAITGTSWRRLGLGVAILVIVAVAAARLYRGAHYPTDVLGSVVFAVPWLLVTTRACASSGSRWVRPDQPVGVSTSL